ncbi:MAG: DUF1329 domain-containing protein [Pseudomonadota bacterium]
MHFYNSKLFDVKKLSTRCASLLCGLALISTSLPAIAKVSAEEAARLGKDLTPMGGEMAANAAGTIPTWTGGITAAPGSYKKGAHHSNPFPEDKPLFVISAQNINQYVDQLTPGQKALFKTYPTWKMPVYATRRTASYPTYVYDAAKANATRSELANNGNGVVNAAISIPFPIPQSGLEVVFNHNMRWRGTGIHREVTQVVPTASGEYSPIAFVEDFIFDYGQPQKTIEEVNKTDLLFYFKQKVVAPARLAGSILLVHETIDQVKNPRRAWIYNTGQRRVRRAPQVSYDNPGTASDGMRTNDNFDMFNGSPDRYDWKLVGKKEIFIPYNAYDLHSDKLKYEEIVRPGHINPDHTRYELHRVWVVEGSLKNGMRHLYSKRVFFIDEDTWQIGVADHYDGRGQLWRVAEAHALNYYEVPVPWHTLEVLHDLQARRYLVLGLDNESKMYEFGGKASPSEFTSDALRREGLR